MVDALTNYPVMSIPELAGFLNRSIGLARELVDDGTIPSFPVGKRKYVDPLDAIVYKLSGKEGVSAEEYWARHGDAVVDHARRYFWQIVRLQGAA